MSLEDDLLNISEAARLSGKSVMTIRKYLGLTGQPSRLPNARKIMKPGENQETWQIPLSDLFNAGIMKGNKPAITQATPEEELFDPLNVLMLKAENEALKKLIAALEANLADLRLAAGRSIETAEKQEERRKKFWQR
jgi:hypothetical protein